MQQFHKTGSKLLWICTAASLLLSIGLSVGNTHSRYQYATSIDHVFNPQTQWSLPQKQAGSMDYLQENGQSVWLAPWSLPAYGETNGESKTYTFSLSAPAAATVHVTGTASVNGSAVLNGKTITLTLTLTDAGSQLLTAQKNRIRVSCGDTYGDFYIWLLPTGVSIPTDADQTPVELNQICKSKTDNVYLKTGEGTLVLSGTDRNSYRLTFLHNGAAIQGLRYSLDKGVTYTQLHDWNQINLPRQDAESTVLLLDYSQCGITAQSSLQVQIQRQNDTAGKVQTVTFAMEENLPQLAAGNTAYILTPQTPLQLDASWNGCAYSYELYRLTGTGNAMTYQKISAPAGLLIGENGEILQLSIAANGEKPEAGTYCLRIKWEFEGVTCEQAEVPFFINYSLF